jgi:putative CocE/NonD family hydrolase
MLSLSLFAALAGTSFAQAPPAWRVRDHYEKIEYMIPMRDGKKLYTAVYVPKDFVGSHPILLERTPYSAGPYGPTAYRGGFRGSRKLVEAGYIFAYQDVRGKYLSEGDFVNVRPQLKPGQTGTDESTDTYDTVDFLVKRVPANNGAVGMWGISYPGFYTGVGAINTHPNLKAVSPQAPVSNWFVGDDFHHNGALFLQDGFDFLSGFGQARPVPTATPAGPPPINRGEGGAYGFFLRTGALPNFDFNYFKGSVAFWQDMMRHPNYDEFWQDRALPDKMKNVKCAVLTVGGLFDAEDMWGALNLYRATERQNRGIYNALVMGPWYHGMWSGPNGQTFGELDWGSPTSGYFQEKIEFPFFERFLRGQNVTAPPEATIFDTGAHAFRTFGAWPVEGLKSTNLYLAASGGISGEKPTADGFDGYVADPANPTPYTDPVPARRNREHMLSDQRFATARPDVVTYRTAAMAEATTYAGPITADLWVTTTGTDGDFIVKVIDEYPADSVEVSATGKNLAGYQMLVRWEVMRGRFRDDLSRPKAFEPGKPTRVRYRLNDILHTFRPGHRLVVQIQSSMFPLIDRNPNRLLPSIYQASNADFQKATVRILRSPKYPTHLEVARLP